MRHRPIATRPSVAPLRGGLASLLTVVAFLSGGYQTGRGADGCPMHDGVSLDGRTIVVAAQAPAGADHDAMRHGAHGASMPGSSADAHGGGSHGSHAEHGPCGCVGHCSVLHGPAVVAAPSVALAFSPRVTTAPARSSARVAHRDSRHGRAYLPNAPPASA